MPSRLTRTCLKVVAAAFTSLVAPLTVHVVESDIKADGDPAAVAAGSTRTAYYGQPTAEADRRAATLVVGRATGKSADDALRNAGLAAIREALAAEVDPATMALRGPAIMESVRIEPRGIVRASREVSTRREWRLGGVHYHSEIAVEVDLDGLRERVWGPPAVRLCPPAGARAAATGPW